jgi:hypothetical protein
MELASEQERSYHLFESPHQASSPFSAVGKIVMLLERSTTMSIAEILPAVRALPRSEKLRLARLLLDDLAGEELLATLKPGQEFPIHTPEFAPGAAAQLATLLEKQGKPS